MNNQKQIGYALNMYINSNDGKMCPRAQGGRSSWSGGWGNWLGRTWDEYAYEQMTGVLDWGINSQTPVSAEMGSFTCPLDSGRGWNQRQRRSYRWNNGRAKGVDNNAKTSDFNLKPFMVNGVRAAYGDGEDTQVVMLSDYFYNDNSADATLGFNGGSMGVWWSFRLSEERYHEDLGRNALLYDSSVKHFKRPSLTADSQLRTYFDYKFPANP